MRISELSIQRPVLATVANLLVLVAGGVAFFLLPVREYPDVETPVVSVRTVYPGASPLTVEATVTEPLEQAVNGIEDIRSISSSSSFSASFINVEFEAGRDVDLASADVANAIQSALGQLPPEVEKPIVTKASSGAQAMMYMSLAGADYSLTELSDIADRIVKTRLQIIPGVAEVGIGGERRYAMRIWLDPVQMAARGVDAADVRRTVRQNNLQVPAGELEAAARKFNIEVQGQIDDPRVYERLVIREERGLPVRIGDVGRVELGAANYQTITRRSGEPSVGLRLVRQSNANELEVSRLIHDQIPAINAALPSGVALQINTDNSIFVRASLEQVWETLGIVFAVVVLVNLIFLRSPTTTAITAVAIPVSLVGTFAVMQVLGFSLNVLTMLSMVLAIGLLVDDSIVVMENIYRRRELGESRLQAARRGSREVAFPVIATTAAVVAVLIPLSLMIGNTGRLFREFALAMAAAVIISTFVALTLVPMLCSKFLRIVTEHGRLFWAIEALLQGLTRLYRRSLAWCLDHRLTVLVGLASILGATIWVYGTLPRTLVPTEDRGAVMSFVRAPQGSTAAFTNRALEQAEAMLARIPEVEGMFAAVAFGRGGAADTAEGILFSRLVPWEERQRSQQEIVRQLQGEYGSISEATVIAINRPSLGQSGRSADVEIILQSPDAELDEFRTLTERITQRIADEVPGLVNLDTNTRLEMPQLEIELDRERAADLGIPISSVADTLRLLISQGPAAEFVMRNKQYDVVMALASQYRSMPEQLGEIHLRAVDGTMVPLATVARAVPSVGAASLNHYGLQRSASITANLGDELTMEEALERIFAIVDHELPSGWGTSLGGASREFVESSGVMMLTFAVALLVIYLVLAAQFESFVHPLTVILSVPLAAFGALATLKLSGNTLNLYSGIGLILLVGLVTKNSILLVDFANQERARGSELLESLRAAGRVRFRPILMTSMTSILGAIPLAAAVGAGAETRHPIGAAVVGGLLFSTLFTLLMIPAVYVTLVKLAERLGLETVPPLVELDRTDDPLPTAI